MSLYQFFDKRLHSLSWNVGRWRKWVSKADHRAKFLFIFVVSSISLAGQDCDGLNCYGTLNVSLGSDCNSVFTSSMGSPNVTLANEAEFTLVISKHGEAIPNNMLNFTHIGEQIEYIITRVDPDCPNSCWGNLFVEDKFPPQLSCTNDTLVFDCIEAIQYPGPLIIDGCGNETIVILSEVLEPLDCDPDYIQRLTRTYIAVDDQGNESDPCEQIFLVERLPSRQEEPGAYVSVPNFTIANGTALKCGTIAEDSIVGVPTFRGVPLDSLMLMSCNVVSVFTEETLVDVQCKTAIIREWGLFDWTCTGMDTLFYQVQLIEFFDDEPPVILQSPGDIIATTNGYECKASLRIPPISYEDNCNDVKVTVSYPGGFIDDFDADSGEMAQVNIGSDTIIYSLIDLCGNISRDTITILVEDSTPPVAVCKVGTAISLSSDGQATVPASVFDEGSYDDCAIDSILIRKMNFDDCGLGQDTIFSEKVTFCCSDITADNNTVMLVLQVNDKQGHSNECMIEVEIQDKGSLNVIQGLPDITLTCDYPIVTSNLNMFGSIADGLDDREAIIINDSLVSIDGPAIDGYYIGSCNVTMNERIIMDDRNQCGIGSFIRSITIWSGTQREIVNQRFTFLNNDPFFINVADPDDPDDMVIWPVDVEGITMAGMCDTDKYDVENLPIEAQEPRIIEGTCDLVAVSLTNEEIFNIVDDDSDACFKILREWTVIDWCQTNNSNGPMSWKYTQAIKISNETPPTVSCTDVSVNSADPDCGPVDVTLSATAQDDCSGDNLVMTYTIDLFDDNSFDSTGVGFQVTESFPVGKHVVYWQAEDRCGNFSQSCEQMVEVINTKSPPAICIQGITTDLILMDTDDDGIGDTPMVCLNPHVIHGNKKDTIDCAGEYLKFSFSADTSDIKEIFDCSDVGTQVVRLYVTDSNGNQSFCETNVEIQDNMNLCDGGPNCQMEAVCKDSLVVEIESNGLATLNINDLYDGQFDVDCQSMPLNLSLVASQVRETRTFNCFNLGEQEVSLFVSNFSGPEGACTGVLSIIDPNNFCDDDGGGGCLNPAAVCRNEVNVVLDATGNATLLPGSVYGGSVLVDCNDDPINFAFSENGVVKDVPLNCSAVGSSNIRLYVTKPSGVVSSCGTTLNVSAPANNDVCDAQCVEPTISCEQNLRVDLNDSGEFILNASQVYSGIPIVDCDGDALTFSFSANTANNELELDCDLLGLQNVELFMTTADNMQTSCNTTITVTATAQACPSCNAIELECEPFVVAMRFFDTDVPVDNSPDSSNVTVSVNDFLGQQTELVDCNGDPITFSFSENSTLSETFFSCNNLGSTSIAIFARSLGGQTNSCTTTVTITDNSNSCPDILPGTAGFVQGNIIDINSQDIEDVMVYLDGSELSDMTDQSGFYAFDNMPFGGQYIISPVKDNNHIQGITTLDLVLMQRHILGKQPLGDPFRILAADVNQSGKVSSADMIEIKRMILGESDRFLNSDSWRFVSEDHVFFDLENPNWASVMDEFIIDNFERNVTVDFTGIKLGDVNGDAIQNVETRSNQGIVLQSDELPVQADQEYRIPIRFTADISEFHGFQLSLEHKGLELIEIENGKLSISEESYVIDNIQGKTIISWVNEDEPMSIEANNELFWLVVKAREAVALSDALKISQSNITSEFYYGSSIEIAEPILEFKEDNIVFTLFQNEPNPWMDETFVQFNIVEAGEVELKIWDLNGSLQYEENRVYQAGNHSWPLIKQDIQTTGVFIIEMSHAGHSARKKMLLIQ